MPTQTGSAKITVKIENAEASARFCALLVTGVKAVPSPLWLQKRLEAASMRPINLIVDLTNYVMLEYGQPIHAYDRRFVAGDTLQVSWGRNEDFVTLDASKVQLRTEDILISDTQKVVGLAGIMGGQNSEIKDDTTEVIIEVAHFAQERIRKTARRLGLHSEAGYRFERGIDVEKLPDVLKRVTALLSQCTREQNAGEVHLGSALTDCYVSPLPPRKIALRLPRVRMFIANPVYTLERCTQHLKSLGFTLCDKTEERMLFEVPSWRNDIHREVDLIEELARLEGYDTIPYEIPRMAIAGLQEDPYLEFSNQFKRSLATLGLCEIMSFPFVGAEDCERLLIPKEHGLWPTVRLANALNERQAFLQTSLVGALLNAALRNRNHGTRGVRLFEMARTYFTEESKTWQNGGEEWQKFLRPSRSLSARARGESGRVIERELIAGLFDQPFSPKEWHQETKGSDFYHVKTLLVALLRNMGISKADFTPVDPQSLPFLHPHAAAWIGVGRERLGWVGEIHPQVANTMDLGSEVPACFEIDMEAVFEVHQRQAYKIKEPTRFPAITRDLALLVAKDLSHAEFQSCVRKFPAKKNLSSFRLFDLYEGEQVGQGLKSFASSYIFQSPQKTLTDEEVDAELGALVSYLKTSLGAVQR